MIPENKKRVMVTLSKDVAEELENIAVEKGFSKSALITMWVNENRKAENKKSHGKWLSKFFR